MDKVLKVIKSRFFLSALAILLQFIQLLLVFYFLNKYSIIISMLGYIFYVGVFLFIINKYKSPEFKLPWVIILMLFFVNGAFIFILLIGNEENKKSAKKYELTNEKLKPYLNNTKVLESLEKENMDAYLQANYIYQTSGLPAFKNTKVTYYKIGEEFFESLLIELNKAQKFIFMEYFIIENGIMWDSIHDILKQKVEYGVKVYVIYDDFGCMTTLDEKYYELLKREGINSIPSNIFKPIMSNIHNNRDHRKITVIDGTVGFTGGINLADEYINKKIKHGHWKDTAIKLEGEAVKSLTALFLSTWNKENSYFLEPKEFMEISYKEISNNGVVIPYGDGPEEFYKDNIGKNVYVNIINSAKNYVYITTPYLICDYELLNAISLAAKKGVDVRIITPHIPDKKIVLWMTQSNYNTLLEQGVKIYEYTPGFIHAKSFVCDDIYAICGTINLDYRSLVHHFECGTWIYKSKCIIDMKKDFLETIKKSEIKTIENSKLKGIKKLIAEVLKVFSPLL